MDRRLVQLGNRIHTVVMASGGCVPQESFLLAWTPPKTLILAVPPSGDRGHVEEQLRRWLSMDPTLRGYDLDVIHYVNSETFLSAKAAWEEQVLENSGPAPTPGGPCTSDAFRWWLTAREEKPLLFLQTATDWTEALEFVLDRLHLELGLLIKIRLFTGNQLATALQDSSNTVIDADFVVVAGLPEDEDLRQRVIAFCAQRATNWLPIIVIDTQLPKPAQDRAGHMQILRALWFRLSFANPASPEPPTSAEPERSDEEVIHVVAHIVADDFNLPVSTILNRQFDVPGRLAREATIYLARKWKNLDFKTIGRVVGRRAYVSVAQAFNRIESDLATNLELRARLDRLEHDLRSMEDLPALTSGR